MTSVRWLRVQHETRYDYDAPVELAHHVAYLGPRATEVQQVRGWTLSIDPLPDEWLALQEEGGETAVSEDGLALPAAQHSLDSWGNQRLAFSHSRVHERLTVRSTFEAGSNVVSEVVTRSVSSRADTCTSKLPRPR